MHTTIYKIDKHKDLLYNPGNYIQYLIITILEKNARKNVGIYI